MWPLYLLTAVQAMILFWFLGRTWNDTSVRAKGLILSETIWALALLLWFFVFGRLPRALRLGGLMLLLLSLLLFRVDGFNGYFAPQIVFRFGGDVQTSTAMGVVPKLDAPAFPAFLGPRGDATLAGPELSEDWRDLEILWRIPIGKGYSGFVIAEGVAVTQEVVDQREYVSAYDLSSGAMLWRTPMDEGFRSVIAGGGPRATPAIVNGRVYAISAGGRMICAALKDGSMVWTRDLIAEEDMELPKWGHASSPLPVDDLIVIQIGGEGDGLIAYEADGTVRWRSGSFQNAYASPRSAMLQGRRQLVTVGVETVLGFDPVDGREMWRAPWKRGANAANVLVKDDMVMVSAGNGLGCGAWDIPAEGAPQQRFQNIFLKSKMAQMFVYEDYIYGLDEGIMVCLDPQTGERIWKQGRYGHGQMLLVGDRLLLQSEKGVLHLIEIGPEGHRVLARQAVLSRGKSWNNMALAGDILLMRNAKEAVGLRLPTVP